MMERVVDERWIRGLLNVKLYFEGPSSHYTREMIEIIDEYVLERLPVLLNDVLEPYGLEASLLSGDKACEVLRGECRDKIVFAIYSSESENPVLYAVYRYRAGDNTLELQLESILEV